MEAVNTTTIKGAGGRRGGDRKKAIPKSVKAGLQFPVGRIARFLKKGRYAQRMGTGAPIYMAAVLEYLAAEVIFFFSLLSNSRIDFFRKVFDWVPVGLAGAGIGWKRCEGQQEEQDYSEACAVGHKERWWIGEVAARGHHC